MRLVQIFDIPICRYSLFNVRFQRHLAGAGMTYIGRKAVRPLAAHFQPFAMTFKDHGFRDFLGAL
jgi:hypothetical protein